MARGEWEFPSRPIRTTVRFARGALAPRLLGRSMSDANAPGESRQTDRRPGPTQGRGRAPDELFAALDLGTNNCRLLVAARTREGFRVVDAYSRIVRLGEGLTQT